MLKYFRIHLAFSLAMAAGVASGQTNNPFGLRWKKIRTDHFNILFPAGYEKQGLRMANTLEAIHDPEASTMGGKTHRIPVVLQNQSAVSNGFVTLAPWRSEFFGMPPQDYNFIGTNDWLTLLASHEYRHMVQFTRSRTGVNKAVYGLFGQHGLAVTSFMAAPQWFWEGDAVATETAFTPSGRGRMPNFSMLLRTNLQEGRTFNYNKQYLRSYKHNISDHYVLGYHMISYLRAKTGKADIWERIAGRAWRMPFIPFTFSRSIKKETGMNINALYREMAADFTKKWQLQNESVGPMQTETINPRRSMAYTDYLYPQAQADGSVIAWKKGIGEIDQLVQMANGREKKLFTPGPVSSGAQLSVQAGRVVWNEYRYNPRWQLKSYVVVMSYDLNTGRAKQITSKSRYAGAALSPDGTKVATIETTVNYETSLVVLDFATGNVVQRFLAQDQEALAMPRWVDNQRVIAVRTSDDRKSIAQFDIEKNATNDLLTPIAESIGHPVPFENLIFFNSPFSGIDNIFVYDRETGKRFQVTTSKYGAYNPNISADGKWIYFNDQTKDGFDIVRVPFQREQWTEVKGEPYTEPIAKILTDQEGHADLLKNVSTRDFPIQNYRKASGMFNFHSWGLYASSSLSNANVGVYSQDVLNTTTLEAGYNFDLSERTGAWTVTGSYQGFYPIIDFTVSHGNRKAERALSIGDAHFEWTEQVVAPTLRLPLLLTNSKYNRQLILKNGVSLTHVSNFANDYDAGASRTLDILDNGNLITNEFGFEFTSLMKRSRRDFLSKWGQHLEVNLIGALKPSDFSARTTAVTGYLFFPGLFKHHSFYAIGAYQNIDLTYYGDNYLLRNQIPRPRGGFGNLTFEDYYFASANYSLPVWYPDISAGPFVNLQRIRANMFFDHGLGETHVNNQAQTVNVSKSFDSTGVEIRFDGNIMRLLGQFDLGFRYSYRLSDQTPFFEFLIGGFGF